MAEGWQIYHFQKPRTNSEIAHKVVILFTFALLVLYLCSHGDEITAMMWKKIDNQEHFHLLARSLYCRASLAITRVTQIICIHMCTKVRHILNDQTIIELKAVILTGLQCFRMCSPRISALKKNIGYLCDVDVYENRNGPTDLFKGI
jgi:hypothetical protein